MVRFEGTLDQLVDGLPAGFDDLRAEAASEGYRFIDRLAEEWDAGEVRFNRAGELLLAGQVNNELAGVGGLTIDPVVPAALRMRRFYVRPPHRRSGVGRQIALALLERARVTSGLVTVNAQPDSFAFWESIGFVLDPRLGLTHVQYLTEAREL
jgi:GNAT superfamily N-acetyltransferase